VTGKVIEKARQDEAEAFVRGALARFGQVISDQEARSVAAKVIKSMPPYRGGGRE
jgi:hypothetical protein